MIQEIIKILYTHRFPLIIEKDTQEAIEKKFSENNIKYNREYRLDKDNIPDFFIDGAAIEIKIKGKLEDNNLPKNFNTNSIIAFYSK